LSLYIIINNNIYFYYILGIITTIAGTGIGNNTGDDGPATSASLDRPRSVAIDPTTGDVYIADNTYNIIRLITKSSGNNYIIYITIKLNYMFIYIYMYLSIYLYNYLYNIL
jgi:hypothetical protein